MSKRFTDTERKYEIYDRELLGIIQALKEWRHYIQGSGHTTVVFSNHKTLTYFRMVIRMINESDGINKITSFNVFVCKWGFPWQYNQFQFIKNGSIIIIFKTKIKVVDQPTKSYTSPKDLRYF